LLYSNLLKKILFLKKKLKKMGEQRL